MKKFIQFLILFGFIIIIINLTKRHTYNSCPKPEIKYVYVNRDFKEEQENPYFVSEIIGDIFSEKSVWFNSIGSNTEKNIK